MERGGDARVPPLPLLGLEAGQWRDAMVDGADPRTLTLLQIYTTVRVLVSLYVFFTGFGQTISMRGKGAGDPLGKMAMSVLRINLFVALIACAVGQVRLCVSNLAPGLEPHKPRPQPWMLYYICPMHTLWTGLVILANMPWSFLPEAWQRYAVLIAVTTLVWHIEPLFNALFGWMGPLVYYQGKVYEWYFRSKLDMYSALVGCLLAEARPYIEEHLNRHDSPAWVAGRVGVLSTILALYAYFALGMPDRVEYNKIHPYIVFIPLVSAILLRNSSAWLRARHSWLLGMIGRHSLELYLLQFDLWLGALAKGNG